ncbi:SUMF1/EgtB/PvdO family nonheme iron enzyme [Inquilinus sp. Marseille-Q2685]|uniref:formylglycine-generating enzyme family protein n=1 Tax=Inquilinus sp. Marseille-Q2685 TaxID=2866581 RepID=UPI001CE494C5|nr:SUMF1/EgtB/PvdO family nonheme iron enzyme [Inquilinus sp. Marseille-Q2685]
MTDAALGVMPPDLAFCLESGTLHPLFQYEGERNADAYYARRYGPTTPGIAEGEWLSVRDYGTFLGKSSDNLDSLTLVVLGCGNLARESAIVPQLDSPDRVHLIGVELSDAMIARARAAAFASGLSADIIKADMFAASTYARLRDFGRAPFLFSLLGGTLNNFEPQVALSTLAARLEPDDLLWIDFPIRQPGPDDSMIQHMQGRLDDTAFVDELTAPLRKAAIGLDAGRLEVTTRAPACGEGVRYLYTFRFNRDSTTELQSRRVEFKVGQVLEIFGFTRLTSRELEGMFDACGLQCVDRQIVPRQGQYLLRRRSIDGTEVSQLRGARHAHWPDLGPRLTADMSDRSMMGYPDTYFQSGRWKRSGDAFRRLSQRTAADLVAIVQSPSVFLEERIAAGQILAIIGDPRIQVDDPEMVDIPGGEVAIGLEQSEVDYVLERYGGLGIERAWILKEVPRHLVRQRPYRIGRYPVTNGEYRAFLEDTGHPSLPTSWSFGRFPVEQTNHPVHTIDASDAEAYTKWLSARTARRFRLPTEAEWEFAAAGPSGLEFPWGNRFEPDHANTAEAGLLSTTPIGVFPDGASPFGVLDMAGNVEEYVAADYRAYPGGLAIEDDLTRVAGRHRVARGGSFTRFRDLARTRRRHGRFPRAIYVMGFRLAEDTR